MPKRILIIGILFILCGLSAGWEIIRGLMNDKINLNFGVLTLFTGIGLLRGVPRSRISAKVWIGIGYTICAVFVCIAFFSIDSLTFTSGSTIVRGPDALLPFSIVLVTFFTLLLIMHTALNTPKAIAYCDREYSAEAFQPRQPLLATLRKHYITAGLTIASFAGLCYLCARPPLQSFTGDTSDIVITVTSEELSNKSADITNTIPHYHSRGSARNMGKIQQDIAYSLEATPEQYNAFFNHLRNATVHHLRNQGVTDISQSFGTSGKSDGAMNAHIHYTRGTRHGSIEITTEARPKPAAYPYEISITAEESY